jgi:2-oxoglutarate ferredoxin oxidoreductase subunit beta
MTTIDLGMPLTGTAGVPRLAEGAPAQTKKEFTSDQEVRWCPGCGDYAILAAVQGFLPELGLRRENIVFVSGIGCSSRFPYYLDTYGLHSIHGRAPAIATGLAASREDLSVWVVTGDGDALSIGGNHLIHALRRNVNLKILLFNNRIYGLTKGQYSPTSETGKITKSTPLGSVDHPFNPVSLALGAEATFVARTTDTDRKHLTEVLRAAAEHRGSALVEIYQNCPIFNDGAFDVIKDRSQQEARIVNLVAGEPVRVGYSDARKVLVRAADGQVAFVPETDADQSRVVVHDPSVDDPTGAFALSRLDGVEMDHVPMGVFRSVSRPTYDDGVRAQVAGAVTAAGGAPSDADLAALLHGRDTWTVE